jgi:hypothetical protein
MSYILISRNGPGVRRKVTLWCYKGRKRTATEIYTENTEKICGSMNFFRVLYGMLSVAVLFTNFAKERDVGY